MSTWSYWLFGLISGAGVTFLVMWLRYKGIALKWYEWLMTAIALLLAMFTFQHVAASTVVEMEVKSAWMLGGISLGLAIILAAVVFLGVWRRRRRLA